MLSFTPPNGEGTACGWTRDTHASCRTGIRYPETFPKIEKKRTHTHSFPGGKCIHNASWAYTGLPLLIPRCNQMLKSKNPSNWFRWWLANDEMIAFLPHYTHRVPSAFHLINNDKRLLGSGGWEWAFGGWALLSPPSSVRVWGKCAGGTIAKKKQHKKETVETRAEGYFMVVFERIWWLLFSVVENS